MQAGRPYRLGKWTIDPQLCSASDNDSTVRLEPKAIELLTHLTSRPGVVVSRTELLAAVWPGVVVGDEVITNAIAKLRRALDDDPRTPRIIETIPKRGYRLVAQVDVATTETDNTPADKNTRRGGLIATALVSVALVIGVATWHGTDITVTSKPDTAVALPDRPSITVLPFANLSDDASQEFFVDGLTEDLITDLSRISGLFVIARNSSFTYKGRAIDAQRIGQELGVRFVLTGSARRHGEGLRINVNLIDTESGRHLWAERFEGSVEDVFVFQERITGRITEALSIQLTGSERDYASFQETLDPAAYEAFLMGWAAYRQETPEGFRQALEHFRHAAELDPAYGRAFAAMAAVYWEAYQKRWDRRLGISPVYKVWELANDYLARSMVAPSPLAHKIASAMLTTNRRYDEAIAEAQRAIAIDPNDPLGHLALADVLVYAGEADRAHVLIRKAMRLDPQVPHAYLFALGKARFGMNQFAESAEALQLVAADSPDNRLAWMMLASAHGTLGKKEKATTALAALQKLQQKDKLPAFTIASAREYWPYRHEADRERFMDGLRKAGVPEW